MQGVRGILMFHFSHNIRVEQLAADDARCNRQRTHWPGAPHLSYVDSEQHVRLLAMARLGLLPIEIEEGRWRGIPRGGWLCLLGCGLVGDIHHFLNRCAALTTGGVGALDCRNTESEITESPFFFWRAKASKLECRWRERTRAVRDPRAIPENPADAQDDAVEVEVDTEVRRRMQESKTTKPQGKRHSGKGPATAAQSQRG